MRRWCIFMVAAMACNGTEDDFDVERLMDPETCKDCHNDHYEQWLGSMHAYAADDPVFVAMNARGQRETNGALGDFCVNCHAPLAVRLGKTTDGLNLRELPQWLKGVNCYFCHNVTRVNGTHNNPLELAMDGVMRGNVADAVKSAAHGSDYSPLQDGLTLKSADVCGACHDIVNDNGVHLERTYEEWLGSLFAKEDPNKPGLPDQQFFGQTCNNCHMNGKRDSVIADAPNVAGNRVYHDHRFAGVDVALTPFPDAERAPALEQDQLDGIDHNRNTVMCASLCVRPTGSGSSDIVVWLHNEAAGHNWPSGAAQDRRAWVEVVAERGGELVYQSGIVADDQAVAEIAAVDPDLWQFRDWALDAEGNEVHMFWEAEQPSISSHLPVAPDFFGDTRTWRQKAYGSFAEPPDKVTLRVLLRPIDFDLVDDLVASGDLDPAILDKVRTFTVPPVELEWTAADAEPSDGYGTCVSSGLKCRSPYLLCSNLIKIEYCETEPTCVWNSATETCDPK